MVPVPNPIPPTLRLRAGEDPAGLVLERNGPGAAASYAPRPVCGDVCPTRTRVAVGFDSGHAVLADLATGATTRVIDRDRDRALPGSAPRKGILRHRHRSGSAPDMVRFNRDGTRLLLGADSTSGCCTVFDVCGDDAIAVATLRADNHVRARSVRGDFGMRDLVALTYAPALQGVSLWSASTGRHVGTISTPDEHRLDHNRIVRFSPDGASLAVAGDYARGDDAAASTSALVYDVETRAEVARFPLGARANDLAWAPDGSLASITDLETRVWDVRRWTPAETLRLPGECIAWSDTSDHLVCRRATHVHLHHRLCGPCAQPHVMDDTAGNAAFLSNPVNPAANATIVVFAPRGPAALDLAHVVTLPVFDLW